MVLDTGGFVTRPTWSELRAGTRPTSVSASEPGEWQHGWQYHASSPFEFHFREAVVFAQSSAADQAHLRSHSGGGASEVLCVNPTKPEFTMAPSIFRTVVLERLRLPLSVTEATCACGRHLDSLGRHRAACPHSGKLRTRGVGPERTVARICREAGALVRCNVKLRDMNVMVPAMDEREVEVVASGLLLQHGAQLAIDVTLRSALTSFGIACTNAVGANGAVLEKARRDKEAKHAELVNGARCHPVVMAIETGGRWSNEALDFVADLAAAHSREAQPALQRSTFLAWRRRWTRMLAVSCSRAFAASLISAGTALDGTDGVTPDLADLLEST